MSDFFALIGRICMSAVFIAYGLPKFTNLAMVFDNAGTKRFMDLIGLGNPAPTWFAYLIAAIEFLGGIALLLGIKTRWVAGAFVVYVALITYFAHPFWLVDAASYGIQKANFYKNLGIIGGLLMLALYGPGAVSFDGRSASSPKE
jgi:putative oxidoreductase